MTTKKVIAINGENQKGGFVKFEKSAKNIEFSVWLNHETLANIKVGSILELETASIRPGTDKDGNQHPVRWNFTDKKTGEIRNLKVGQGTLDYRIKILKITTPKTAEVLMDIS